ncbi:MAG TPA: phosphoserine phosphatase SerB [Caulobacteraceae bacterium]|nr:phosphoserine phosphatase SerB [Caulobacteraceae bacterium]
MALVDEPMIGHLRSPMPHVLTLVAPSFDRLQDALPAALEGLAQAGRPAAGIEVLGEGAADLVVEGADLAVLRRTVSRALERQSVDFCVQPAEGRLKRLLVADMDSTIIGVECLDELADYAGLKAEIAAVTARAMAGEIAFETALRDRVALLAGLELATLERAYAERVRLNAGAARLVATMTAHGARCVLVSGGFDFFTARVAEAAGFASHRANRLIADGQRLTGQVAEPILGREAKLAALAEEAAALGVGLGETLAVGDGANDLAMIEAAGLGVAYRAKPVLAAKADARIDHTDLTALLYFQGIGQEAFA